MACYRRRSIAAVSQDSHRPVGGPRLTVGGGLTGRRSRSFVAAKGFLAAAFTSSGRCSNFPGRCNCSSPDRCSCYFAAAAPAKRLFKPTGATIRGGGGATIRPKTTISAAADSYIGSAAATLVLLLIIL